MLYVAPLLFPFERWTTICQFDHVDPFAIRPRGLNANILGNDCHIIVACQATSSPPDVAPATPNSVPARDQTLPRLIRLAMSLTL